MIERSSASLAAKSISVVSTRTESSAGLSGAAARLESCSSRWRISRRTWTVSCWSDSEEGTVRFLSDGKWQAETDETWISVVTGSGRGSGEEQTLRFRLSPNQTDSDRTGILTLFTKDGYETILVTQLSIADRSVSHHFRDVLAGDFSRVYICAHRANTYEGVYMTKDCPENSVPAIRKAIEKGLDMVELDVRQTKDGVLVCAHDDNLASVTTGSGSIAERYFSDIRQFDMKIRETGTVVKGVRMPRLSEALAAAKDRIWVNLDLDKTAIAAASVLKEVEKAGMLDQVTFFTGSDADLAKQYYEGSKGRISLPPWLKSRKKSGAEPDAETGVKS